MPEHETAAASKNVRILAVESSCDETACAVVENGRRILANAVYSQIDLHAAYGGVVPEIASRAHIEKIDVLTAHALAQAGLALAEVDAIAVTCGPGLVGALLVGVAYAKGLALALNKPLIAVNHIEGHIYANVLTYPHLAPPFVCLVVSGGHSHLLAVDERYQYILLGCTQDDAAGEAMDKAARVLGLGYPGGPKLDALAQQGDERAYSLPKPKIEGPLDFSFSGLKTAFINLVHTLQQRGETVKQADLAACFRRAVVDQLLSGAMRALQVTGLTKLVLAGGVAANSLLRQEAQKACAARGIDLYLPEIALCGDNAAMIAAAAYPKYLRGDFAQLDLNAYPSLRIV